MTMLSKQDHGISRVVGSNRETQDFAPFWLEWLVIKLLSTLI
jgi:hypothetical protein